MYWWINHIINQDFSPYSLQISSPGSIFDDDDGDEIKCLKGRDDEAERKSGSFGVMILLFE